MSVKNAVHNSGAQRSGMLAVTRLYAQIYTRFAWNCHAKIFLKRNPTHYRHLFSNLSTSTASISPKALPSYTFVFDPVIFEERCCANLVIKLFLTRWFLKTIRLTSVRAHVGYLKKECVYGVLQVC